MKYKKWADIELHLSCQLLSGVRRPACKAEQRPLRRNTKNTREGLWKKAFNPRIKFFPFSVPLAVCFLIKAPSPVQIPDNYIFRDFDMVGMVDRIRIGL